MIVNCRFENNVVVLEPSAESAVTIVNCKLENNVVAE